MLDKINGDFYCSRFPRPIQSCDVLHTNNCVIYGQRCECYHRKHPTPEQYKEEYGRDVPDDMPVWVSWKERDPDHNWQLMYFETAKHLDTSRYVVIACTPFGKPDKDWRSE